VVVAGHVHGRRVHALLDRAVEAELGEPRRRAAAPAGGVHDEVGAHLAVLEADAGDRAAGVAGQADRPLPLVDRHVGQGEHPLAQVGLQARTADAQAVQAGLGARQQVAVRVPDEVALHVDRDRAARRQLRGGAREELVEHGAAAGEQAVQVYVVWHALAVAGAGGQRVAVVDVDGGEGVAEHTRGEQAADPRPEDHRVPPVRGHVEFPLVPEQRSLLPRGA
jgi:hypothetical protein